MGVNVELKDVTPKSFRLINVRSLDIKVNGSPFCSLLTTRENYVLGWNGRVDLPTFEDEVFERLRLSIPFIIHGNHAIKEAAKATVLTKQADLIEFHLRSADDDFALQRWLSDPNDFGVIGFIRVDVGSPNDLLNYSFSTENNPNSSKNELALRLPRMLPIRGSLMGWVIEHHQRPLRLEIGDEYQIADVLNKAR